MRSKSLETNEDVETQSHLRRWASIPSRSNHLDLALKALDLHRGWSQRRRFLFVRSKKTFEHGRADCQDDDGVQFFVDGSAVDLNSVSYLNT